MLVIWWAASGRQPAGEPRAEEAEPSSAAAMPAARPAPSVAPPSPPAVAPSPDAAVAVPVELPDALPPSHPITPEREKLARQAGMIQGANDAMDLGHGAELRALAIRYRLQGFEDTDKLGEGYEIVADCLEHPGPASRAAGQAFYDRERGSILRRYVRRHCLEAPAMAP